jgi:hypothetical protein
VGVGLSGKYGGRRWCIFNASILTRAKRRWDEKLPEDEEAATSSYWLYGKKAWYDVAAWRYRPKERR